MWALDIALIGLLLASAAGELLLQPHVPRELAPGQVCTLRNNRRGSWIGRFCRMSHQQMAMDLCWSTSRRAPPTGIEARGTMTWADALRTSQLVRDVPSYMFQDGVLQYYRIPRTLGLPSAECICCPNNYICLQRLDSDQDAHIRCVRDPALGPAPPGTPLAYDVNRYLEFEAVDHEHGLDITPDSSAFARLSIGPSLLNRAASICGHTSRSTAIVSLRRSPQGSGRSTIDRRLCRSRISSPTSGPMPSAMSAYPSARPAMPTQSAGPSPCRTIAKAMSSTCTSQSRHHRTPSSCCLAWCSTA